MTKNILVTGVSGNLGRATKAHFEAIGWQVTAGERKVRSRYNWPNHPGWPDDILQFDIVAMCHGKQKTGNLGSLDVNDLELIDANLISAIWATDRLVAHNQLANNSLIVYCSSIQATQPRPGRVVYAAAKAGLEGLCRAAATQLADIPVRTVCLRLGQMERLMTGFEWGEGQREAIEQFTPLPWVSFEDTAKFVEALYGMNSLSGEVFEISSGHKFSVWPE